MKQGLRRRNDVALTLGHDIQVFAERGVAADPPGKRSTVVLVGDSCARLVEAVVGGGQPALLQSLGRDQLAALHPGHAGNHSFNHSRVHRRVGRTGQPPVPAGFGALNLHAVALRQDLCDAGRVDGKNHLITHVFLRRRFALALEKPDKGTEQNGTDQQHACGKFVFHGTISFSESKARHREWRPATESPGRCSRKASGYRFESV